MISLLIFFINIVHMIAFSDILTMTPMSIGVFENELKSSGLGLLEYIAREYHSFLILYGKDLNRSKEKDRLQNFATNLALIKSHQSSKKETAYRMGLNEMADWHPDEIKSLFSVINPHNHSGEPYYVTKDKRKVYMSDITNRNLKSIQPTVGEESTLASASSQYDSNNNNNMNMLNGYSWPSTDPPYSVSWASAYNLAGSPAAPLVSMSLYYITASFYPILYNDCTWYVYVVVRYGIKELVEVVGLSSPPHARKPL